MNSYQTQNTVFWNCLSAFIKTFVGKPYLQGQKDSSTSLLHKKGQFSLHFLEPCHRICIFGYFITFKHSLLFVFSMALLEVSLTVSLVHPSQFLYRYFFCPFILLKRLGSIGLFSLLILLSLLHNLSHTTMTSVTKYL